MEFSRRPRIAWLRLRIVWLRLRIVWLRLRIVWLCPRALSSTSLLHRIPKKQTTTKYLLKIFIIIYISDLSDECLLTGVSPKDVSPDSQGGEARVLW